MPTLSKSRTVSTERRPCYYVQIAGIPVLYGSVMPPAKAYDLNGTATPYASKVSILPGQGMRFERSLNVRQNLIECRPVDVVLASLEMGGNADASDPGSVFGRLGFVGADGAAELAAGQSITQTEAVPFDLTFGDDPGLFFAAGDVIHIGREAFLVGSINSANKTATITARGVMGTRRENHLYDSRTQVRLVATKPAVFFRGRRAVIYEGSIQDDGTGADWVERWRGFVATEPEISTNKTPTVTIKVSPLTALLDQSMGSKSEGLTLNDRAHAFDAAGRGCFFEFMEGIPAGAIYRAETGMLDGYFKALVPFTADETVDAPLIPLEQGYLDNLAGTPWHGTGRIPVREGGALAFQGIFATDLTLERSGHPFTIPLRIDYRGNPGRIVYKPIGVDTSEAFLPPGAEFWQRSPSILIDNPSLEEVRCTGTEDGASYPLAFGEVVNAKASHIREADLSGGAQAQDNFVDSSGFVNQARVRPWPDALIEVFNYTAEDVPQVYDAELSTRQGFNISNYRNYAFNGSGFLRLYLDLDRGVLCASSNVPIFDDKVISAIFTMGSYPVEFAAEPPVDSPWINRRWLYPFDSTSPGGAFPMERRHPMDQITSLALRMDGTEEGETVTLDVAGSRPGSVATTEIPIQVARAFYTSGEMYLLVDGPVTKPENGDLYLEVVHPKDGAIGMLKVHRVADQTLEDGTACTKVVLRSNADISDAGGRVFPSFAEYHGEERIELRPAAVFPADASIGEVILQLLCSSGGNGLCSSSYDVLPYGAGLVDGTGTGASADPLGVEVDRDSFLAITSPIPNAVFRPVWRSGDSIRKVIGGLLRAAGYVLDIATNEAGECKLQAVPLGLPNRAEVVANLGEGDIGQDPHPRSTTELLKANTFNFQLDYDAKGQAQTVQRVKDAVSIDISGEEKSISVPLPGVTLAADLDRVAQLRPIFSRLRYELALPRRVFEVAIRAGFGLQARVGGTYSLTHRNLRSATGMGISNELVRLRSIIQDGWKATARARFVYYGQSGSGWGPAASVTYATSTSATLSANIHSPEQTPALGESVDDGDGFENLLAGDLVMVIPVGDMDNPTIVSVVSISDADPRVITFDGPHGLASGGSGYLVTMRSAAGTVPDLHAIYGHIGGVTIT